MDPDRSSHSPGAGRFTAAALLLPSVAGTSTSGPCLAAITIMGSGRVGPTVSAAIALIGTVVAGLALSRANRRIRSDLQVHSTRERTLAALALVLGTIGLIFGVVFLATADGGPGTGNGVVGSVAA